MKKSAAAEIEVISLLAYIEKSIPALEAQRQVVSASEKLLQQMIDEYQKARFTLFKTRLKQEKKQGWCTINYHLVPYSGLCFVFKTGIRWLGSHETDSLRDYAELHRACPECRRKALGMSGSGDGSAIHFAYLAKKNGKNFLYKKHGQWLPLPEEAILQKMPESALTKTLAMELCMPKAVDYSCCPFQVKIGN